MHIENGVTTMGIASIQPGHYMVMVQFVAGTVPDSLYGAIARREGGRESMRERARVCMCERVSE